jgi:hypothetical protein
LPGQEQIGVRASNGHVVIEANGTMPGYWTGVCISLLGLVGTVLASRHNTRATVEARAQQAWQLLGAGRRRFVAALARRRKQTVGVVAAFVVLGLLLAAPLSPGTRLLIQPALEGVGMRVAATDAEGRSVPCEATPLQGLYSCGLLRATEAGLGITPTRDDAGEFGKFWPGLRAHVQASGVLVLKFPRVDARSGTLTLTTTLVSGSGTVVVRTSKGDTEPTPLSGNQSRSIRLPGGLSRSEPLELRLSAGPSGLDAVLRGELP